MAQARSLQTRTRILEAAQSEFARHGYDATGVAELCRVAGVTKGAFYHHFPSKQEVFLELLGSGAEFGVNLTYEIQEKAGGIAQALGLAEKWADDEPVAVILGDNIFQDDVKNDVASFRTGAKIFLKEVPDAGRFGVAELDRDRVLSIEEKPKKPKSNYAVTGLYLYDAEVFSIIRTLKPSGRGELEITDVNNAYLKKGIMQYAILKGFWSDAGTFDSLIRASVLVQQHSMRKHNED